MPTPAHIVEPKLHGILNLIFSALVLFACAFPLRASAQSKRDVIDLNKAAMEDYAMIDIEASKTKLLKALVICKKTKLKGAILARTYMNLGIVASEGEGDRASALNYFGKALDADPKIRLDPYHSTPNVQKMFELAKRQHGGGQSNENTSDPEIDGDLPHSPPASQLRDTPTPIYVGPVARGIAAVKLSYRGLGMRNFDALDLEKKQNGFGGYIPCDAALGNKVEYYLTGYDRRGNVKETVGSESKPFVIRIVQTPLPNPLSLPGEDPVPSCSPVEANPKCSPGEPGCESNTEQECITDGDCNNGYYCGQAGICVEGKRPSSQKGDPDAPSFFLHIGGSFGAVLLSDGMLSDRTPTNKTDPPGRGANALYRDCGGSTCISLSSGLAMTSSFRMAAGCWFNEVLGVGIMFRYNPSAGNFEPDKPGPFGAMMLGARVHFNLTKPVSQGFHTNLYLGYGFGQIQVQAPNISERGAASFGIDRDKVERPYVINGWHDAQVGLNVGLRFARYFGIVITPELHFLFPKFSVAADLAISLELSI